MNRDKQVTVYVIICVLAYVGVFALFINTMLEAIGAILR